MKHIYSTLSNDQNFCVWVTDPTAKQLPKQEKVVFIAGKANVMNKKNFVTPQGVLTTVSDDEFKALEEVGAFKRFVERGFITVETKAGDADKVAANMKGKDKSAQITADDVKKAGKKATTNKKG